MPDLGDLLGFDFAAPDPDWLDALSGLGAPGDLGDFMYFDTDAGVFVDGSTVDPSQVVDMYGSPSGVDPNDPSAASAAPNAFGGPSGTSLSDQVRSRAADSMTDGTQPFDAANMADPSASIASADDSGLGKYIKALAGGLGSALTGAGGGLSGLAGGNAGIGALTGLPGIPGLTAAGLDRAGTPGMGGMTDAGGLPGLQGLVRPGMQDPVTAALMRLQADPGARLGLQAPVDPGPPPVKFTPLQVPVAGPVPPMAGAVPQPRMSGLQKLMAERMG